MARVKQTGRKGPAKKKSGADKRRSPRIAAQNELEDYDARRPWLPVRKSK